MIAVRAAVPEDLDAIRAVYRRASLSNAGDRDALLAHPDLLVWSGELGASGRVLVAVDGGAVIGFAATAVHGGGLELEDLFTDPDARRRGVAMRLVDEIVTRAAHDGHRWIEVTGNLHAAEFYAAAGFVHVGEEPTTFGPAPRLRKVL